MSLVEIIEAIGSAIDVIGVAVIAGGAVLAALMTIGKTRREDGGAYDFFRRRLGRAILLGLEFLVAADIIRTVAVTPSGESVAVLAGIVLIRTFLSFSLETEIEGVFPWRRSQTLPRRNSSGAGDASGSEDRLPGALERSGATAPHHDKERWRHERS